MKKETLTIIVLSVLVLAVGITAVTLHIFRPQQYSVALITDGAGVDDHSFFQSIHEGAKENKGKIIGVDIDQLKYIDSKY